MIVLAELFIIADKRKTNSIMIIVIAIDGKGISGIS